MKRIVFSDEAKAHVRAIPQHIAMNILVSIYRFAESGAGRVTELKGTEGEKRLRVGDHRVRFTEEEPDTLRIHTVKKSQGRLSISWQRSFGSAVFSMPKQISERILVSRSQAIRR